MAGARPILGIPRQLRPPRRFKTEVFAHDHSAAAGQIRARLGHVVGQRLGVVGKDRDAHLVFAEHELVAFELVERDVQVRHLAARAILRRDHLVGLAPHDLAGMRLGDEAERLHRRQFERCRQHVVEHAGMRDGRVLLEAVDRRVA